MRTDPVWCSMFRKSYKSQYLTPIVCNQPQFTFNVQVPWNACPIVTWRTKYCNLQWSQADTGPSAWDGGGSTGGVWLLPCVDSLSKHDTLLKRSWTCCIAKWSRFVVEWGFLFDTKHSVDVHVKGRLLLQGWWCDLIVVEHSFRCIAFLGSLPFYCYCFNRILCGPSW